MAIWTISMFEQLELVGQSTFSCFPIGYIINGDFKCTIQ